ncbi:MAG TPA: hypothetical protein VF623_02005, partial [Segetibacter sp.]
MENNDSSNTLIQVEDWYSDEFISNSVISYLKENGYKVQKENLSKENEKPERIITASKFFKKEIIEVKGFPQYISNPHNITPPKATHAK